VTVPYRVYYLVIKLIRYRKEDRENQNKSLFESNYRYEYSGKLSIENKSLTSPDVSLLFLLAWPFSFQFVDSLPFFFWLFLYSTGCLPFFYIYFSIWLECFFFFPAILEFPCNAVRTGPILVSKTSCLKKKNQPAFTYAHLSLIPSN
jgi:hypothetical protein